METVVLLWVLAAVLVLVGTAGLVLPAMPGWYHGVSSLADLVDFVVARILDQLGVAHNLMRRWGDSGDD